MLKAILANLVFRKDDVVIMDMEAGLEHLGRGTAAVHGPVHRGDRAGARDGADL